MSLALGGAGKMYGHFTNPAALTGQPLQQWLSRQQAHRRHVNSGWKVAVQLSLVEAGRANKGFQQAERSVQILVGCSQMGKIAK